MGGTTPSGFDSSGFVNYVFQQHGVDLNRTHADMWENNGTHEDNPQPGDVVFFEGTYKDGVSHRGIYHRNGQMIHASTEATGDDQTATEIDNTQPGDVEFFEGTYKDGVSHSGIYLGNGQMIHAGTEATGVEQTSTEIDYWSDRYIGAKRF